MLLLFSVSLLLFSKQYSVFENGIMDSMRALAYPLSYLIGFNFIDYTFADTEDLRKNEYSVKQVVTVVSLGAFLHYAMNFIINIRSIERNSIDVWSKQAVSATGQAVFCSLSTALFVSIIFSDKKLLLKLLSVAGLIVSLAYSLVIASRTCFILIIILTLAAALFFSFTNKNKRYKIFLWLLIAVVLVILAINLNVFGIRACIMNSNMGARFYNGELFEDTRLDNKVLYLGYLLTYPLGGGKIMEATGHYAHDLLLDLYSDAGFAAVALMIAVLVISAVNSIRLIRNKNVSGNLRLLILLLFIVFASEFSIEPIIAGMPWFFCTFCIFEGMLERHRGFIESIDFQ